METGVTVTVIIVNFSWQEIPTLLRLVFTDAFRMLMLPNTCCSKHWKKISQFWCYVQHNPLICDLLIDHRRSFWWWFKPFSDWRAIRLDGALGVAGWMLGEGEQHAGSKASHYHHISIVSHIYPIYESLTVIHCTKQAGWWPRRRVAVAHLGTTSGGSTSNTSWMSALATALVTSLACSLSTSFNSRTHSLHLI